MQKAISMVDTVGKVDGKIPGIVTALATKGISIAYIVALITVTSKILQACISDVNPTMLILIFTSIVVLYSTFGDIQSATITDILQCAIFTIYNPIYSL